MVDLLHMQCHGSIPELRLCSKAYYLTSRITVTRGSLCVSKDMVCGPMCNISGKVSFGSIKSQENSSPVRINGLLVSIPISSDGEEGEEGATSTGDECHPPHLPVNYVPQNFTSHVQV